MDSVKNEVFRRLVGIILFFSHFAFADRPLLDQLIPVAETKPRRVIIATGKRFLGDNIIGEFSLIPLIKQKYGLGCEVIVLSPWASVLKESESVTPIGIPPDAWTFDRASRLISSYIASPDDLVIMEVGRSTFHGHEEFKNALIDNLTKFPVRTFFVDTAQQIIRGRNGDRVIHDERGMLFHYFAYVREIHGLTSYDIAQDVFQILYATAADFRERDLRPYLADALAPDLFYAMRFGDLRLKPVEEFILLNMNGGDDKAKNAGFYGTVMIEMIEKLRSAFPNKKILLTSPQGLGKTFGLTWLQRIAVSLNLLPKPQNSGAIERETAWTEQRAPYMESLEKLANFIREENSGEPMIGILDYRNAVALARAITDASLVISQDTGLVHMAYQRRNLARDGAPPEVLSLSFEDVSRWRLPSQRLVSGIGTGRGKLSPLASDQIDLILSEMGGQSKCSVSVNRGPLSIR